MKSMVYAIVLAMASASDAVSVSGVAKSVTVCEACKQRKPSDKEVVEMVFASHAVPLAVHPTCANVSSEKTDTTIGQYLAGFMVFFKEADMKNLLDIKVTGNEPANKHWLVQFSLGQHQGEVVWSYGVQFEVDKSTGQVNETSFRCIGA